MPSRDDVETGLGPLEKISEPQKRRKLWKIAKPQILEDFPLHSLYCGLRIRNRKRASDNILGGKPTSVEDARTMLNLGGGNKVAGTASSSTYV